MTLARKGAARRRIAFLSGLFLLIGLALCWQFGSLMVRPRPMAVAGFGPAARSIRLRASDGAAIAGTFWPGRHGAPALLLLHGLGASRGQFAAQAAWMNSLGYAVLAIDFRGHGESQPLPRTFGVHESRDAAAAFAWLRHDEPKRRVGVVGISLGGAAALLGDAGPLPADALVLQAVYPDIRRAIGNRIVAIGGRTIGWLGEPLLSFQSLPRFGRAPWRIAPVVAVRRYRGPLLVIGGADDRYTPAAETRELFAAAPGRKTLWIVPGLDHAGVSALDGAEYRARLRGFLTRALGWAPARQ